MKHHADARLLQVQVYKTIRFRGFARIGSRLRLFVQSLFRSTTPVSGPYQLPVLMLADKPVLLFKADSKV